MLLLSGLEMTTCFQVEIRGNTGTAFIRGSGTNTYFVTAAHVVGELKAGDRIKINRVNGWLEVEVASVSLHPDGYDVAAFTTIGPKSMPIQFSQELPALSPGAELKFLGFPHGLSNSFPSATGFSTPMVRTAFFSGVYTEANHEYLVLDGFNNPGYSGGPIYGHSKSGNSVLVGVISGYRVEHISHSGVFKTDHTGKEIQIMDTYVKPNSGMILATALGKMSGFLKGVSNFNIEK